MRRRDGVLVLLLIALGLVCLRLGLWQLDRLEQRRARNARIDARLALPPLPLSGTEQDREALEYRRVTARGTFDLEAQVILVNRALDGVPGVHLLAPLLLEDTQNVVLVDRGWIPIERSDPDGRAAYDWLEPVEITGIARLSQPEPFWSFLRDPTPMPGGPALETWRLINLQSLQRQLPYPLLPIYIEQTEPIAGGAQPTPDPGLDRSDGPHLSYAIQWFSFSAIAIFGGAAWYRHRRRLSAGTGASGS